jgi:serine protease Do
MIHRILLSSLLALAISATVLAETVKDREGTVRQDRAARENDPRWIYNDVDRGFAEARRTGKPLLVVLRCVPCLACAGIDAQVLTEGSALTRLPPGRTVPATVLRGTNRLDLPLPIQ